jgi:hypothetical protein
VSLVSSSSLKTEEEDSSETLVNVYYITLDHNSEDKTLQNKLYFVSCCIIISPAIINLSKKYYINKTIFNLLELILPLKAGKVNAYI